jgi:hypothetical protein
MMNEPVALDPGERLLWSGKPKPISYAFKRSWATFLFGIFFFGFSLFWIAGASFADSKSRGPFPFPFWLFGIPFVAVGAGMVLSPVWHFWRGAHLTYVITSKRAITIFSGAFGRRENVPLAQIKFIDVNSSDSDTGDVYFKETWSWGANNRAPRRDGFLGIPNVSAAERTLRQAVDKAIQVGVGA